MKEILFTVLTHIEFIHKSYKLSMTVLSCLNLNNLIQKCTYNVLYKLLLLFMPHKYYLISIFLIIMIIMLKVEKWNEMFMFW